MSYANSNLVQAEAVISGTALDSKGYTVLEARYPNGSVVTITLAPEAFQNFDSGWIGQSVRIMQENGTGYPLGFYNKDKGAIYDRLYSHPQAFHGPDWIWLLMPLLQWPGLYLLFNDLSHARKVFGLSARWQGWVFTKACVTVVANSLCIVGTVLWRDPVLFVSIFVATWVMHSTLTCAQARVEQAAKAIREQYVIREMRQ